MACNHLTNLDIDVAVLFQQVERGAQVGDVPLLHFRIRQMIGNVTTVDRRHEGQRLPVLSLQVVVGVGTGRLVRVTVGKLVVLLKSQSNFNLGTNVIRET